MGVSIKQAIPMVRDSLFCGNDKFSKFFGLARWSYSLAS